MKKYNDEEAKDDYEPKLGTYLHSYLFQDDGVSIHFFQKADGGLAITGTKSPGVSVATVQRLSRLAVKEYDNDNFSKVERYADGYGPPRSGSL